MWRDQHGTDGVSHGRIGRFSFSAQRPGSIATLLRRDFSMGVIELEHSSGLTGTGFFQRTKSLLPELPELVATFTREIAPQLVGTNPFVWTNRTARVPSVSADARLMLRAVSHAMWDLQGKLLDMSLFRLLGGTNPEVEVYANCYEFALTDEDAHALFRKARADGFTRFKVRIGHPDVSWDIDRLRLVQDATGPGHVILADANEAWTPTQAIERLDAIANAGIDIHCVENPCGRYDFVGLRSIVEAQVDMHVMSGKFLSLSGKLALVDAGAVDIVTTGGSISAAQKLAWITEEFGLPIVVGRTNLDIGVHIAASLPNAELLEYGYLPFSDLLDTPVEVKDGNAYAPERPGHGLQVRQDLRSEMQAVALT